MGGERGGRRTEESAAETRGERATMRKVYCVRFRVITTVWDNRYSVVSCKLSSSNPPAVSRCITAGISSHCVRKLISEILLRTAVYGLEILKRANAVGMRRGGDFEDESSCLGRG